MTECSKKNKTVLTIVKVMTGKRDITTESKGQERHYSVRYRLGKRAKHKMRKCAKKCRSLNRQDKWTLDTDLDHESIKL